MDDIDNIADARLLINCVPRKLKVTQKRKLKVKTEPHAKWKSNYKIVKEVCTSLAKLAKMVTKHRDDDDILRRSQLVGHEGHTCDYLPSGKKITYVRAIAFSKGTEDEDEKNAVAARVQNFVNNTKKFKQSLPSWKEELLDELEVDIFS